MNYLVKTIFWYFQQRYIIFEFQLPLKIYKSITYIFIFQFIVD